MTAQKVLVIQTAYIGDVVLTTPLVRELHRLLPDAAIDVVTTPLSAEVFRNSPHVRHTLPFDKHSRKLLNLVRLIGTCRREGYGLSISVQTSMTSALLAFLSGVPRRIGFSVQPLTTDSVPYREVGHDHRRQRILSLLSPLGLEGDSEDATELFITPAERDSAIETLGPAAVGARLLALAPGSVRRTKMWPEESYVALLEELSDLGVVPVLIGGAEESGLCRRIIEASGAGDAINLAGRTSLLESATVLERAELLVCGDSAPLHIAGAVGTPVLALFGPTVRDYGFFPFGPKDMVFETDLDCRPCSLHGGRRCPRGHHRCMRDIDPRVVAAEVRRRLGGNGGG